MLGGVFFQTGEGEKEAHVEVCRYYMGLLEVKTGQHHCSEKVKVE